jgi:hypothetical protein
MNHEQTYPNLINQGKAIRTQSWKKQNLILN